MLARGSFLYFLMTFVLFSALAAQEAGLAIRHWPQEKVMRETWVDVSALVGGKGSAETVFASILTGDGQPLRLDLIRTCRQVPMTVRIEKPNAVVREGANENFKSLATPQPGTILSVLSYSAQRHYYQVILEDNKSGWILEPMVKPVTYGEIYSGYLPQQAMRTNSFKYTISAVDGKKKIITSPEYAVQVNARIPGVEAAGAVPPQIQTACKNWLPYYLAGGAAILGGVAAAVWPTPDEKGDLSISVSW